ncbi:MAG: hypothetical protein ACOC7X_05905 [Spirochaetota bacterium]
MKPGPRIIRYLLLGLLVLWFPSVPLLALDAPTQVNDGTGSDIDTQSSLSKYSANWTAPNWDSADPEPASGDTLSYIVSLEKNTDTGWEEVSNGAGEIQSEYPDLPATRISVNIALTRGVEYRVGVVAQIDRGGASAPEKSDPPAYSDGFLVPAGAGAELSVSPGTLAFQEDETQQPVELNIQASGAGGFTITSLSVQKTFPNDATSSEPVESLNIQVAGGGSTTISKTLSLSSFDRAQALGGSQSGSMTVTYRIQGSDSYGNPVEAVAELPVSVSAALPSDLQITGVEVELPQSPYYAGDVVQNARVIIQATGSGQVSGQILIDDEEDWTEENTFSVSVDGQTSFDIEGEIPTDDPGEHTVKAELSDPVEISGEASYTISDETPPFPPETLSLVTDVAELSDFDGQAEVNSNSSAGYQEFVFNGTAKMKLLSLEDTELEEVTVTDLRVRYDNDKPTTPKIKGGTVEKEAEEEETFVTVANEYLKVKKVSFDGQDTSKILVDAKLALPKLYGKEIMNLEGLVVKTEGIEGKSFSYSEDDPKSFKAFGMDFGIHDVKGTGNALIVGEDKDNDRYYFTMSGSITMESKKGTETKKDTLTTFQNVTFYSDDQIDGEITFSKSFDLIPDKLSLTEIKLESEDDDWKLKLKGKLKGLPSPLDVANDTEFEISFDKDGNASGGAVVIKELEKDKKGHKLGGDDESEYDLGIGTLDLTYLQMVFEYEDGTFDKDQSEIRLGVDFYLNVQGENGEESSDDGRRISFGELNSNGDFEGGVRLTMEGDFDWHSPTNAEVLSNKQLSLPGMNLAMDAIAVQSEPFGIAMTGSIVMGMDGVSGGINFQNLVLSVDGTISNLSDAIEGGQFEVADSLQVEVGDVDWSTSPSDLSFESNETTGEGADQAPKKGDKVVAVKKYLRITDASVTVGDSGNPSMSGGFEEFTFYDPVDGGRSFVLRRAQLETVDIEIMADVEYSADLLRLAGTMAVPGDTLEAAVVGKFGRQDGQFTMGVFVAATGLNMAVAPGVFLDGIGGGVFVNPVEADIELVRSIAGFKRPELEGEISEKRPGGAQNPGAFALMLMGDFYVAEKNLLSGRALLTLTANYFALDAEASYAANTVEGVGYLAIGWDPGYAEGNINLKLNYFSIFKGEGNLGFYVYGPDTWGVAGEYNLYMYDQNYGEISTGELFIGPPGLMVRMDVTQGMDLKVVSGKIVYEGMFWYWAEPASSKFGLYASVTAQGEILKIASGKASLEAALIPQPSLLIYAVGSVKLEVLSVEVFKGSMWVSASLGGFDGGRGTKSQYDQMIADARNMADEMEAAKDELMADLEAAQLELMQLSPEQLEAAGIALVEANSSIFSTWEQVYQDKEINKWPGGLPPELELIRSKLFGPAAQQMAAARSQLESRQAEIASRLSQLNQLQAGVVENFENYEDLILEDLPSVADLSQGGSPFGGFETQTVTVNGQSKTVKVGFDLDMQKAEQQVQSLASIREEFAAYQDAFIEQSGRIDAKLRDLDRILYKDQYNLSELNEAYTDQYQRVNHYVNEYIEHQMEQGEYAESQLNAITSGADAAGVREQSQQLLSGLSQTELQAWIEDREFILEHLISSGGEDPSNVIQELDTVESEARFVERGKTLWWEIPTVGFNALKANSEERLAALDSVFGSNMQAFRNTWSQSSLLVDQIYTRKADLYALLNEMYDQLARYGHGDIGVLGNGNAAGFEGLSETGLGFRSSAAASGISAQAVSVSAATTTPAGPADGESTALQLISDSSSIGFTGGFTGDSAAVQGAASQTLQGTAYFGAAEQTRVSDAVDMADWSWVPVSTYFSAKRDEIAPYLENPVFSLYTGSVSSSNQYSAVVEAEFAAEHPVEVVEYSWTLQPHSSPDDKGKVSVQSQFIVQPGEVEKNSKELSRQSSSRAKPAQDSQPESSGGFLGGLFSTPIQTEIAAHFFIPWFSLGSVATLQDTLLAGNFDPDTYALTIKARGAGGTSSIRLGRIDVDFFDPNRDTGPYEASLDSSDSTPPSTPQVQLPFTYSARADEIYAAWSSSDSESGIQRYEYVLVPYSEAGEEAGEVQSTVLSESAGSQPLFGGLGAVGPQQAVLQEQEQEPYAHLDWQNAGSLTEMNIRGLSLEHGQQYVLRIRATNGAGKMSVGSSDPFTVDLTPPEEAEIDEFVQQSADEHPNSFRFRIAPPEDPESGISACSFALGSTEGGSDLYSWTPVAEDPQFTGSKSISVANLAVSQQQELYLTVRSVNQAGIAADSTAAVTVEYNDSSPPMAVQIALLPEGYSIDTSYLQIGWSASQDSESGIVSYEYGIGTSPDNPDVKGWTAVSREEEPYLIGKAQAVSSDDDGGRFERNDGSKTKGTPNVSGTDLLNRRLVQKDDLQSEYKIELNDLQMEHGQSYYVFVRVQNGAGLNNLSTAGPLIIDTTPPEELQLEVLEIHTDQGTFEADLIAQDPESGIQAYRHGANWISVAGPGGTPESVSIRLTLPIPTNLNLTSYVPAVQVQVMNGAGLTAPARLEVLQ